jgi:carbonic anhydrase
MSHIHAEVEKANAGYVQEFAKTNKGKLPLPPGRHFTILTCMDARLDPAKYAGLVEGDAHVIRNAGGRATDDAIRSLVISTRLLGTTDFFVVHHSDCGMLLFDDAVMSTLLHEGVYTATYPNLTGGKGPSSNEGKFIKWQTFKDESGSVIEDVQRIAAHPLVPKTVRIYGFIYDCATGKLNAVPGASRVE